MPQPLEPRDRVAILCASLVILLVVGRAFYLPAVPLKHYQKSQQALAQNQDQLRSLQQLKQEELARLESQDDFRKRLETRPKTFDLLGYTDELLRQTKLKDRAKLNTSRSRASTSIEPMAELEMTGVSLVEIVDFLHRIYGSGNLVAVYEIDHIRPAKDNKGLDLSLTLVTVKA